MTLRIILLGVLLSGVSMAAECSEFIRDTGAFSPCGDYSPDDLILVNKAAVTVWGKKFCQGVLVADGFVLTAAHCLGPKELPELEFSSGGLTVTPGSVLRPFTNGQDLLLMALAPADFQAVLNSGAIPARIRSRGKASEQLLMLAGSNTRMFFRPTGESDLERLRYFVDSYAGDSGSPIYDSDGFLVGVHSYGSFGADPAGAVYLTPTVDGRVTMPGAATIAALGLFDADLLSGAFTTLYGSIAISAAANYTQVAMEVDGAVVPEQVVVDWPSGWWPAAYGTHSFFIPNRLRDGRPHEYRIVTDDPIQTTLGPNEANKSPPVVLTHHLPTGSFSWDSTTNRFVLQYSDADSHFIRYNLITMQQELIHPPMAAVRACPGLSGVCDLVWLNSSNGTFPNYYTFRYEALVPPQLWLGGQTLSAVVLDNEDEWSIPLATPVPLTGAFAFDVGYPTGSLSGPPSFSCGSGIITASGTAQAVQPGSALSIGLYVDGVLRSVVVNAPSAGSFSISYQTWSGTTLAPPVSTVLKHQVSVQAFNPARPTPALGSAIGTPSWPTFSTILFSQRLQCSWY